MDARTSVRHAKQIEEHGECAHSLAGPFTLLSPLFIGDDRVLAAARSSDLDGGPWELGSDVLVHTRVSS